MTPLTIPRLMVATAFDALVATLEAAEYVPRRVRTLRRQTAVVVESVAAIATDLTTLRRAIEPIEDDVSTLTGEVRGLRDELIHVNAQLQHLVDAVPEPQPDGLLILARDGVGAA